MILQALVENAIRHRSNGGAAGTVEVTAALGDGNLTVTVSNASEAAFDESEVAPGTGFGIPYVRSRLTQFYGWMASSAEQSTLPVFLAQTLDPVSNRMGENSEMETS